MTAPALPGMETSAEERAEPMRASDYAGDMEPHNDREKSATIVREAYGWQVDQEGRLYGLVGGDMGYAATHIVLGEGDRWGKNDAELIARAENAEAERDRAFAAGREAERAEIVAFLRQMSPTNAWHFADAIQRGAHIPAGKMVEQPSPDTGAT